MTPCVFHAARRERVAVDESENESTHRIVTARIPLRLSIPAGAFLNLCVRKQPRGAPMDRLPR